MKVDGILLTLVDKSTNLSRDIITELESNYCGIIEIFNTQIPNAVKVAEEIYQGKSIFFMIKIVKLLRNTPNLQRRLTRMKERKMYLPSVDDFFTT